jgi:hypothetical protein
MVVFGKMIVDAFALQVQELYPDEDIVIVCMLNKQRSSDVWVSLYKYRENCSPILEPYSDIYKNNFILSKKSIKKSGLESDLQYFEKRYFLLACPFFIVLHYICYFK